MVPDEPDTPEVPEAPDAPETQQEPVEPAAEVEAQAPAGEAPVADGDEAPAAETEAEVEAEAEIVEAEVAAEAVAEVIEAELEAEAVAEAVEAEVEVEAEVIAEAVVAEVEVEAEVIAEAVVAEVEVEAEAEADAEDDEDEEEPAPRVKPAVPGAHLEVDIVPEGVDPLGRDEPADPYAAVYGDEPQEEAVEEEEVLSEPISSAAIDLAAGARYRATGKRKTAIARVILRPGKGEYLVNGRTLTQHFTRETLQRNIRQPLETVGYQDRMDVIARLQGGGISAQAGALRHGISRALLEADPNLRGELKKRGFLTRDSRAKERKKAGLKKARKRPQFSKR